MQNIYKYIRGNKDEPALSRAYREGLIFLMINFADTYYRIENDRGVDDGTHGEPLAFHQKRRFRNEIFSIASDNVRKHNAELAAAKARGERTGEAEIHVYDKDVIVNAFFESSLGRNYADKKDEWITETSSSAVRQNRISSYLSNLSKATMEQKLNDVGDFGFIISPYDPMFVDTDSFKDAGTDQIGYIFGRVSENNRRMFDAETTVFTEGSNNRNIVGVYSGGSYGIGDITDPAVVRAVRSRKVTKMYGDMYNSGYSIVERYIKKNNKKREVREYLIDQMNKYADEKGEGGKGREQAPEQYEFMDRVCRYLDDKGIDFDIEVNNGKLVARLDSRREIRLLDRADSIYRGRVYDNGVVYRIGRSNGGNSMTKAQLDELDSMITNDDCMSVIKYYFGEDVKVNVSDFEGMRIAGIDKLGKYKVGEQTTYTTNKTYNTVHAVPGRTNFNGLLLSVKRHGNNEYPINIMISPSCVADVDDLPSDKFAKSLKINEHSFGAAEKAEEDSEKRLRTRLRLPADKIFSEDLSDEEASYTDENGEEKSVALMKFGSDISPEHIEYYSHLVVREELNRWTEAAREAHANATNIDNIISEFRSHGDDPLYEYPYPEDRDVADLQELYWSILSGNTVKVDIAGIEEPVDIGESEEEKIRVIRQHYAAFLEDYFGSVPEITREGLNIENHGTGIVPEHVIKYVNTENSYGDQRNISYIEHMLSRLDNDYSPDFVKGDSYQAMITKNKMLKYKHNGAKEIASFTWGQVCSLVSSPNDMHPVDPKRLEAIKGLEDKPVTRNVLMHTMQTLISSGCVDTSIKVAIDENGVIAYKGVIPYDSVTDLAAGRAGDYSKYKTVSGTIGQVMEPGEYGEIVLKSIAGDSKVMVPGYDAYFVDSDPENPRSRRDNLRLVGYEQRICEAVSKEIHKAVFTISTEYNFVPHSTDLNYVYHNLTATPHDPEEFYSRLPKDPANPTPEESIYAAVIATERNRCRFPTEYIEGATTNFQSMLNNPNTEDAKNFDYHYADKCGYNMRCIHPDLYDVFDPDATGSAKNQGIVLYLNEGVTVDPRTGKPTGVENGRCPLMNHEFMQYLHYDPFARKTMCFNTTMSAKDYALHTGIALMTLDGYNYDDGFIVSKQFAEKYQVDDHDGVMRDLIEGDKISDKHGNKGVISRVIDPMWASDEIAKNLRHIPLNSHDKLDFEDKTRDYAQVSADIMGESRIFEVEFDVNSEESHAMQAAKKIQEQLGIAHLDNIAKLFRDNPNLEVVGSPYSPLSRYNGGTIREMLASPGNLVMETTDENGSVVKKTVEGGMGYIDIDITDMTVKAKTNFYKQEDLMEGKGRKASAQLAWTIQSRGANFIMRENYNTNSSGVNNLREYMIAIGLDMSPNSEPLQEYTVQPNEQRKLIKLTEDDCLVRVKTKNNNKIVKLMPDFYSDKRAEMLSKLNQSGGFMELPFRLDFKTETYSSSKIGGPKHLLPETGQSYSVNGETKPTFGMPVLPPELRSGQELRDGTTRAHDYTNRYVSIYKQALLYMGCEKELAGCKDAEQKALLARTMEQAKEKAQAEFDKVVSDLADNKFNTKYNVFTEGIMSNRLSNSATAVWSCDPHLRLNEVGMSLEHARELGLCNKSGKLVKDAGVMVWRDPCLNSGNARWMKVKIMDHLTGIAINPLADKSFDGDFDGDSAGLKAYKTREARAEAMERFSLAANMLETGSFETIVDKNGVSHTVHPLYIQSGMDVTSNAYHRDSSIEDERIQLTLDINRMENAYKKDPANYVCTTDSERAGLKGRAALQADRDHYCEKLMDWADKSLKGIGVDHLVVKDEHTVIESLQRMVDSGAKGDAAKMDYLCGNAGITYTRDENNRVQMETIRNITDGKGNIITKHELEGTDVEANLDNQALTAYKTDDTAFAGTVSKRGVLAMRDTGSEGMDAMLNTTYKVTQGTLQSKKDSAEALVKDTVLKTWNSDVFDGYKLTGFKYNKKNPGEVLESAEELNSVKHHRVTEKQPKRKYDMTSRSWDFERDENGEVVMEDRPVKCTREEYIYQVCAVLKAFKADANPEDVALMADRMKMRETVYTAADVSRLEKDPYAFASGVEREIVGGFSSYSDRYGSLLDKAGYGSHLTALLRASNKSDGVPIFTGINTNAVSIVQATQAVKEAEKSNDKSALIRAEEKLNNIYSELPNSCTFAPTSFVRNVAAYNLEDWDSFKPVGRQDAFLAEADYSKGYGIMGESQKEYESRMQEIRESKTAVSEVVNEVTDGIGLDDQPISETQDVKTKVPVSNAAIDVDNPFEYDESLKHEGVPV